MLRIAALSIALTACVNQYPRTAIVSGAAAAALGAVAMSAHASTCSSMEAFGCLAHDSIDGAVVSSEHMAGGILLAAGVVGIISGVVSLSSHPSPEAHKM